MLILRRAPSLIGSSARLCRRTLVPSPRTPLLSRLPLSRQQTQPLDLYHRAFSPALRTSTTFRAPPAPNHLSEPGPYSPPTSGVISHLPSAVIPYAELVRLDKPTGTLYLLLPCLWSTLMASCLIVPTPPITSIAYTAFLFASGAFVMRSAGCTINDLWDRRIDPLVARTRHRPIARGAITSQKALAFTAVQLLAGLTVLVQFPLEVIVAAIPSLLPVALYPAMKRVTNYPQVALGVCFSWGAVLGFPAMGMSLLESAQVAGAAAALYMSNVLWTVCYDTVYAMQDLKDDKKAGVKSTAVAQEGRVKVFLAALAVGQVGLLGVAGWTAGLGTCYWAGSVGGAALGLAYMIRGVRAGNAKECGEWFSWCAWAVGGVAIGGGLAGEVIARKWKEGKGTKGDR